MAEFDGSAHQLKLADENMSSASRGCPFAKMTLSGGANSGPGTPVPVTSPLSSPSYSDRVFKPSASRNFSILQWISENQRLITLYEDFVHLVPVRNAWEKNLIVGEDGVSRPVNGDLMALLDGLETYLVTLSLVITDERTYINKRSRIDTLCRNFVAACHVLCLLQPMLGADWTTFCVTEKEGEDASEGLGLLLQSLQSCTPSMPPGEQKATRLMVQHIFNAYSSVRVTYGTSVGLESQLLALVREVNLNLTFGQVHGDGKPMVLNYRAVAQSRLISDTLYGRVYIQHEDFFFRTMHLTTECWGRSATTCIDRAYDLASAGRWASATEYVEYAAAVLNFMGDHLLTLCTMILRDYLAYKPEIYGASGEGSVVVKRMRSKVTSLMPPLLRRLRTRSPQEDCSAGQGSSGAVADSSTDATPRPGAPLGRTIPANITPSQLLGKEKADGMSPDDLQHFDLLGTLYLYPDRSPEHAEMYGYCKALEMLESSLLSGFYHKHFVLASNVIGSHAMGTMHRNVQALKSSYSANCFPLLDVIRYTIAAPFDDEYMDRKGLLINEIAARHNLPPAWPHP